MPAHFDSQLDCSLAACRTLATSHYENFHVLSGLVPKRLRDDFAVLYSFCRAADDAADERESTEASLSELNALRTILQCIESDPGEIDLRTGSVDYPFMPFVLAWRDLIGRHKLSPAPFHKLLDAFVQDQYKKRYETWEEIIDYCTGSADPVGRLVLLITNPESHYSPDDDIETVFPLSDATCTALQLTNFWQDVSRDYLDRDRIYIPQVVMQQFDLTEDDLGELIKRKKADDRFIAMERYLVEYTQPMFARGRALWPHLNPAMRPVIKLFTEGGEYILREIRKRDYDVLAQRPTLSKPRKAQLYLKTKLAAIFGRG